VRSCWDVRWNAYAKDLTNPSHCHVIKRATLIVAMDYPACYPDQADHKAHIEDQAGQCA